MQDTVEWRKIKDFPNYSVSNYGEVRNDVTGKILKPWVIKAGYKCVGLREKGITYKKYIHRLVAVAFIANKENKETVNHKDGNKQNNAVDNLEWATYSENNYHAYNVLVGGAERKAKQSKDRKGKRHTKEWNEKIKKARSKSAKRVLCVETGIVYESINEAARKTNTNAGGISEACHNKKYSANNYHWEFA